MQFKGIVRCHFNREMRENREKFVRFVSPCSCPSCCSRVKKFTWSVCCLSNREMFENCESYMVSFFLFASFAPFAVHASKTEFLLSF